MELFLQRVENFRPHAYRVEQAVRPHRHDHEFLKVDGVVGVHPAVDDVHHRHGQHMRANPADIAIERQPARIGSGLRRRQTDAQQRIRPEPRLVRRPVERNHRRVDLALILGIKAGQFVGDLAIDGRDRLFDAFAHEAGLVAVTQFNRFIGPCRRARGYGGAAKTAVLQQDIDLNGGVSPAVDDLAGVNVENGGHGLAGSLAGREQSPAPLVEPDTQRKRT